MSNLIDSLTEIMPPPGAFWAPENRIKWLNMMGNAIDLLYADSPEAATSVPDTRENAQTAPQLPAVTSETTKAELVQARPLLRLGSPRPSKSGHREKTAPTLRQPTPANGKKNGRPRGPLYELIRTAIIESQHAITAREIAIAIEKRHTQFARGHANFLQAVRTCVSRMSSSNDVLEDSNENGIPTYAIIGGQ